MAAANPYTYATTSAPNTSVSKTTGAPIVPAPVVPSGSLNPELIGSVATATYCFWFWRWHNGSLHL